MKFRNYVPILAGLLSCSAYADELAGWAPHQSQINWTLLGQAQGTDVYINYSREGRIADITLKSGIYDSTRQLTQVNIIQGYFGCPEGAEPQYLEHAVSTTYDAISHGKVANAEASLTGDNIAVTSGSVIETAAKLACADATAQPSGH